MVQCAGLYEIISYTEKSFASRSNLNIDESEQIFLKMKKTTLSWIKYHFKYISKQRFIMYILLSRLILFISVKAFLIPIHIWTTYKENNQFARKD